MSGPINGPIVGSTVEATLVVLPSAIWKAELEAEFVRAGIPADRAPISATRVLHRICGHAGYHHCFLNIGEEAWPSDEEPAQ
jgi:hypothetical protein